MVDFLLKEWGVAASVLTKAIPAGNNLGNTSDSLGMMGGTGARGVKIL